MGRTPSVDVLRRAVVRVGRDLHRAGFVAGTAGNLSVRLPGGRVLATPSGLPKGRLSPRDLVVVDSAGEVVSGRAGLRPTSEIAVHLEVYRRRPDVNAVVHAHPPHAVALSMAGRELERCCVPEAVAALGPIAVTPFSPPSSPRNAALVARVIADHDVVVLRHHGSLTVGASLGQAWLRLEVLEHVARILALARALGRVPRLSAEQVAEVRALGAHYRGR